jgi:hypothetical protein
MMIKQPFQGGAWIDQFVASAATRSSAEATEELNEIRARQQNVIIFHRNRLLVWASNMCMDVIPTLICWEQFTFILLPACVQYLISQYPPSVVPEMLHSYRKTILARITLFQSQFINALNKMLNIVKLTIDMACSLI